MSLYDTEGLILKTYSLGEADKIVLIFTEKYGLVRGVAKGAKRTKSRFGGSLEPFSVVQTTFYQKEDRELVSIRNIDIVKSYFQTASQPQVLQKFAYFAELLAEFTPPHDPNERLYRMAKVSIESAGLFPDSMDAVSFYFEFWLLRLGGYLPDWSLCAICRREFVKNDSAYVQAGLHLHCADCAQAGRRNQVSSLQRQVYNLAQKNSPENFRLLTENHTSEVAELSEILKKMIARILDREVTSEKFLVALS